MKDFHTMLLADAKKTESTHGEKPAQGISFDEFYQCCVQPNEADSRRNYLENSRKWNSIEYEKCEWDFIPVADKEYLVINRRERQTCGTFFAKPYEDDDRVEKSFTSILIADYGDIREVMPTVLQKSWKNIYFVLNQAAETFASFLKLEGFLATLPPNVKIFATTEEMRRYFLEDHDAYFPRKVFSKSGDSEKYEALFQELHEARVRSGVPSRHALLSVCTPSYNRGSRALQAVQHALTTRYDAEIEIVLVNTGSTTETDGYQQIKNMTDSRLRYYELEKNGGFASSYSSALERASGRFAMVLSDEDSLAVENLDAMLDYLNAHDTLGATTFDVIYEGEEDLSYLMRVPKAFAKGAEGIKWAFDWTRHVSGSCFSVDCLKASDIFARVKGYRENPFYFFYPQCIFSILTADQYPVSNSGIKGWYYGKPEVDLAKIEWPASGVIWPENRIKQEHGAMNLLGDLLNGHDLNEMLHYQINATFNMISLSYKEYTDKLESYRWLDIWIDHYRSCLQTLQDMEGKFEDVPAVISKMNKSFLYWQICKREQRLRTPEENLLPSLQAQVAKYYYEKGVPFEKIDFDGIEKDLEGWVNHFLAGRS